MAKSDLLPSMEAQPQPVSPSRRSRRPFTTLVAILVCLVLGYSQVSSTVRQFVHPHKHHHHHNNSDVFAGSCYQPPALVPPEDEALTRVFDYLSTESFKNGTIARLSGAVRVRTQSFDDLGPIGEDKRWDVFYDFHDYLKATFPRVHDKLQVEKINTHGLLFTWQGSDETLKPTLLMAHQDTVPVPDETLDSWTHPPFEGVYDGKFIWGRGASDCKNNLIGLLETLELLIEGNFEPRRTILASFGFDEECSGRQGAGKLAPFIHDRYGDDGIAVIVDEGSGYAEAYGRGFAAPGVAEKGYTDVDIVVRTPGGHSSIPYDHTGIGILSELITLIEANQYPTYLDDKNPYLGFLSCSAEYAPNFPKKLRKLLSKRAKGAQDTCKGSKKKGDELAIEVAKESRQVRYLMQTSQAVDLINGGVKINAMPETVHAAVNHRINIGDDPELVWDHIAALAKPVADKYNLTLHAFDGTKEAYNAISLSARDTVLHVAPVTPTDATRVTPYAVLAGTVRALWGEDLVVAPAMMTGNTDTRYYWDLTRHIFRFGPGMVGDSELGLSNIHTVNERVTVSNHINTVKWFTLFVRNMDAAEVE